MAGSWQTVGTTTNTYDAADRLTSATERSSGGSVVHAATYSYDVFGNRIQEIVDVATTRFAVDVTDGDQTNPVWAELSSGNSLTTRYLTEGDATIARIDSGTHWLIADRQGSTQAVLDNSGNVVATITYDAFGKITSESNASLSGRVLYTGAMYDRTTGLYHMHWRMYDPANGEFTTEDPIGFAAGDPNLGRYVGNSPTNGTDRSGLDWLSDLRREAVAMAPPGVRDLVDRVGERVERIKPASTAELIPAVQQATTELVAEAFRETRSSPKAKFDATRHEQREDINWAPREWLNGSRVGRFAGDVFDGYVEIPLIAVDVFAGSAYLLAPETLGMPKWQSMSANAYNKLLEGGKKKEAEQAYTRTLLSLALPPIAIYDVGTALCEGESKPLGNAVGGVLFMRSVLGPGGLTTGKPNSPIIDLVVANEGNAKPLPPIIDLVVTPAERTQIPFIEQMSTTEAARYRAYWGRKHDLIGRDPYRIDTTLTKGGDLKTVTTYDQYGRPNRQYGLREGEAPHEHGFSFPQNPLPGTGLSPIRGPQRPIGSNE